MNTGSIPTEEVGGLFFFRVKEKAQVLRLALLDGQYSHGSEWCLCT